MNSSKVLEKIVIKHKERKDLPTPLEVAIKKINIGFIGELDIKPCKNYKFHVCIIKPKITSGQKFLRFTKFAK